MGERGRSESRNPEANSPAASSHTPDDTAPRAAHTASPATAQDTGFSHGLSARSTRMSCRSSGHKASRDAGTLRSGSVLSGNSSTIPISR